jgi:hypothetical protein
VADINDQNLRQPIQLPASAASLPRHAIFQRPFDLTQADFLRLKQFDPVFAAAGGAALSFSLTFGLPLLVRWQFEIPGVGPPSKYEWWIFGLSSGIGLLLLVVGLLVPGQRRAVLKKIKKHFKDNPEGLLYRDDIE